MPDTSLRSGKASALTGTITVPGDKSISHRALMLASQVLGTTRIQGLLEGEDVLNTAKALQAMGVPITRHSDGDWEVSGVGIGGLHEPATVLDMGNSGTGTRLMMGLVTPYPFTTFFTGDHSLNGRPMKRVITPLTEMGARITSREGGRLPLALTGSATTLPITYRLPVASAQVKSAVLLAALNTKGTTTVIEPEATRDHTERMLQHFGFALELTKGGDGVPAIRLKGQQVLAPQDREIIVPADPSSAAFLIVAALIVPGSKLLLRHICVNPLRTGLFDVLKSMGAKLTYQNERPVAGEPVADILVEYSELNGIEVPAEKAPSMIDEYPILAIAAACAKGKSCMRGLSELRVKESDRLSAIIEGLNACGVKAHAEKDDLIVEGLGKPPIGGALVKTFYDHRIAMSFLVLGMAAEKQITVHDGTAIATSFPTFTNICNQIGGLITSPSAKAKKKTFPRMTIAIDGPAASGKGTLARRLAEHLGFSYLDTGSLYRAVGMKLIYANEDPNDKAAAIAAARSIDEEDLANPRLRQERIGQAASIVSAIPEVREALLEFQRSFARRPNGAVLDGRDIGTVVCPEAELKIFITASMEARAKRRHRELSGEGIEVVFQSVLDDLKERDERDQKRSAAPLIPAPDAIVIDSSDLDAKSVFNQVAGLIDKRLGLAKS